MARIRTIKPGFWRHEELSALPEATHLLAASLLNYADDEGYFNANPRLVCAECCPLRELSVSVPDSLISLSRIDYIRLGTGADGKRYGQVIKFLEHQKINRPTPSNIKNISIVWDESPHPHPQFIEPSPTEGNGKEGKGEEGALAHPIPPDWKPKGPNANPVDVKRFRDHSAAKGTLNVDWDAAWEVWQSRSADFGKAKGRSPPETPSADVVWLGKDDPRWGNVAGRWRAVKGKELVPIDSRHGKGFGAFVPADYPELSTPT